MKLHKLLIFLVALFLTACGTFEARREPTLVERAVESIPPTDSADPDQAIALKPTAIPTLPPESADTSRPAVPPEQCLTELQRQELKEPYQRDKYTQEARYTFSTEELNAYLSVMGLETLCIPAALGVPFLNADWESATLPGVKGRMISLGFESLYPGAGWSDGFLLYSTYDFSAPTAYETFATPADWEVVRQGTGSDLIEVNGAKGLLRLKQGMCMGNCPAYKIFVFPFETYYVAVVYKLGYFDYAANWEALLQDFRTGNYPSERQAEVTALDALVSTLQFQSSTDASLPVSTHAAQNTGTTKLPISYPARNAGDALSKSSAPQLFFLTGDRLMKVNADGSGKTLLAKNLSAKAAYLRAALSPQGDLLAFRVGSPPSYWGTNWDNYQPPTLNLFEVQAGSVISTVPIFSTELEQRLRVNDPIKYEAVYAAEQAAIAIGEELAWSPDGRYLAFVAATDGPSSDVYSYDRETGQILRLTDGPHQAAHLLWSSDSQWIVHEEVEWFGGFDTDSGAQAVWAAAPDGSDNRKLYEVEDDRTTRLIDWLSPDTLLMRASSLDRLHLRLVDLTTGERQLITPTTEITQIGYDHVYRWDSDGKRLWTSSAGVVVSLALDGTVKRYPDERELPFESPNGAWLLFECGMGGEIGPKPGLRLYTQDGQLIREIASDLTIRATWSPDSSGVFYGLGSAIYYVSIPDGQPQVIEETRDSPWEILGWVQP